MEVRLDDELLIIRCSRNENGRVKALPVRRFDPARGAWIAPYVRENWDALKLMGVPLNGLPRPEASAYRVDAVKKSLALYTPASDQNIARCRALPDRRVWDPDLGDGGAWRLAATVANVEHILKAWPEIEWTDAAREVRDELVTARDTAVELGAQKQKIVDQTDVKISDYKFGGEHPTPWLHQKRAFALSRSQEAFALLMEQGTGKTRVVVDTACYLYGEDEIDGVLIVCPNSVKSTWDEEIVTHSPAWYTHEVAVYSTGLRKADRELLNSVVDTPPPSDRLRWLVMNVESLSAGNGMKIAQRFAARHRTLLTIDESSKIKTPSAKRTRGAIKLGKSCPYRRILSGTPVTQGPLDLYAQFRFLDPNILGFSSFYSFRNHYAVMGGYNNKQVVAYANLEELQRKIEPFSFRVLKRDCLDLPPKQYKKLTVDLSAQQRKAYREMRDHMVTELAGREITTTIVLTQMMRLQQIVGGFLPLPPEELDPHDDPVRFWAEGRWQTRVEPIPGSNPKLVALQEFLENEVPGKVIIWARFRPEIDLIARALAEQFGPESVVEFHGGISTDDRTRGRKQFQDPDSPVRWFIGQTEAGGMGITLTEASTVIYFSNSFSLESRLQSEDRAHRGGQTKSVTYLDIVAENTLDDRVISALRSKKNLSNLITGDNFTRWI